MSRHYPVLLSKVSENKYKLFNNLHHNDYVNGAVNGKSVGSSGFFCTSRYLRKLWKLSKKRTGITSS
jgi:hypothetical protein